MTKIASNLQIDSARLWDTIHETAKFGATPKGGVRRLTLGPEDKQVRDWFRARCEAAGLEVHVDALGDRRLGCIEPCCGAAKAAELHNPEESFDRPEVQHWKDFPDR